METSLLGNKIKRIKKKLIVNDFIVLKLENNKHEEIKNKIK